MQKKYLLKIKSRILINEHKKSTILTKPKHAVYSQIKRLPIHHWLKPKLAFLSTNVVN